MSKIYILVIALIVGLVFVPGVVLAQDPQPTEEVVEFPDAPPELPQTLPEDPVDLAGYIEGLILFGAGLLAKFLTDLLRAFVPEQKREQTNKAINVVVANVATLAVTLVLDLYLPFASQLADTGIWALFLAVLATQFGAYKGSKLLSGITGRRLMVVPGAK